MGEIETEKVPRKCPKRTKGLVPVLLAYFEPLSCGSFLYNKVEGVGKEEIVGINRK